MRLFSVLAAAALAAPLATAAACPPGDGVAVFPKCPPDGVTALVPRAPASKAGSPEAKRLTTVAVPTLRPGQRLSGTLATGDMTLSDDTFADLYRIAGTAGQRYVITLRSDDFDAYLSLGTTPSETDPDAFEVSDSDDDGAGGTDAQITFTMPGDGTVYVRANSLSEAETGAYTIEMAEAAPVRQPTVAAIRVGQSVDGRLDDGDGQLDDDSYLDLYTFTARAGQTYEITMTSEDFDAYLSLGSGTGDAYAEIEANDDGPDMGTHAQITFTAATSGPHTIRANSLGNGETGTYRLRLVQK